MANHTIFISDLHLTAPNHTTINLFTKFTTKIAPQADALYILGDLFKLWLGDDDDSPFAAHIRLLLKNLSTHIPIYLMAGNRDFTLGKKFARASGVELLPDPTKITLYNRATILTHGDLLCTKDIGYRCLRMLIYLPGIIPLFLTLPLSLRSLLATTIQRYSNKTKTKKLKAKLLPQANMTQKLLHQYRAEQMIHGHIHRAAVDKFMVEGHTYQRISLDEWTEVGNMLVYYQDGSHEFKSFR